MKRRRVMIIVLCMGFALFAAVGVGRGTRADSMGGDLPFVSQSFGMYDDSGNAMVVVECGAFFEYPGVTAWDPCDGDLTDQVVVGGDEVFPYTPGEYVITYNVFNSGGYPAVEVTRTVLVYDETPPVITVLGANPVTVGMNAVYLDSGADALDDCDGDITGAIVADSTVDTSVVGDYTVTYTVEDSAGNVGTATRTVLVREEGLDTLPLKDIVLPEGAVFEWHGAVGKAGDVISYQWYRFNGDAYMPVADGEYEEGMYEGAQTGTLVFYPFTGAMAGMYMLEISDSTTTIQKTGVVRKQEDSELPIAGVTGLVVAAAVLAAAGGATLRRRRR